MADQSLVLRRRGQWRAVLAFPDRPSVILFANLSPTALRDHPLSHHLRISKHRDRSSISLEDCINASAFGDGDTIDLVSDVGEPHGGSEAPATQPGDL